MEEDIRGLFKESDEAFTIYLAEQRFAVNRGVDFFKSYRGKVNFIDSNDMAHEKISKIQKWIAKHVPNIGDLIKKCFQYKNPLDIIEVVTSLHQLFSVHEHQAAGPDVVDPIIIQEGKVLPKYLNQLIALHKESILKPTIIILLKDNDFERAKSLLANCPHGMNLKMIRNEGDSELYKVINEGANSLEEFLNAFAQQCFSTCSHTKRGVLLNEEWAEKSIIKRYSPSILKIRTNLLFDEKNEIQAELTDIVNQITSAQGITTEERTLLQSFECMTKLFRVYCNDFGGQDIKDAYELAKELQNEILLGHVYRYAYFFPGISRTHQLDLLSKAGQIFSDHNMEDHSIYCRNNALVKQFDMEHLNIRDFGYLQEKALHNVPGLVGMSHILNNTGVAHLVNGDPEEAIPFFNKGLDYAGKPGRDVQKMALKCNMFIARAKSFELVEENELRKFLNKIFDSMGFEKLPFISARLVMNIISVAFKQSNSMGKDLLHDYHISELACKGFESNQLGSGQLAQQLHWLEAKYDDFDILDYCNIPNTVLEVTGLRKKQIEQYGLNPFIFNTWL
ncbi:hypothetical protein NST04_25660 [Paenibacillus sp. FSL H7-0756]|uniref:hypothetical protein n=1 Tax=unclassified Paenibacillus TaxID=185978 RepID=UPI0030F4C144